MDKRTRACAQGRHTDRARGQQASTNRNGMAATPSMARATSRTPALLPAQGRQRDGPRQGDPQPHWPPGRTDRGNGTQAATPPPIPPPSAGTPRTRRPTPRGAHSPKPGRGETAPGAPPPPPKGTHKGKRNKRNQTEHGTGAGSAEGHRPSGTALPAPSTGTARSVRATPASGGGGERGRRGSASAHTHKGHAGNTRRATGPSPRNAHKACNGIPASEGKGHPDRTARHAQRGTRWAGRGRRGGHHTGHRPDPPKPPRAPRTHEQGTAPAKAVVAHRARHQPQG